MRQGVRSEALRVPQLTALFWAVKILTTGTGETFSDFAVKTFDPVPVVVIAAAVFAACFAIQFTAGRYVPWRYWLFVTAVAVFGTMVADVAHIVVGIPYAVTTVAFALGLGAVLVTWHRLEGTISIHSVVTARRELLYWLTVLVTFALGTALGDLTATTLHLGYLGSGILFTVLIAVPAVAYRFGLPATAAFWCAYVLTRPLGASFADWLAVPRVRGGLDLGTAEISAVGLILIAVSVAVMQLRARGVAVSRSQIS